VATLTENAARSQKLVEKYRLNKAKIDRRAKDLYRAKRCISDQARSNTNPGANVQNTHRKPKGSSKAESKEQVSFFC